MDDAVEVLRRWRGGALPAVHLLGLRDLAVTIVDGTAMVGLSAISYDPRADVFFVLSDDHDSNARFYAMRIELSGGGIDRLTLLGCRFLLTPSGDRYPVYDPGTDNADAPDPEGIAVDVARRCVYWSSEGVLTRSGATGDPALRTANFDGASLRRPFTLPTSFSMSMTRTTGPRNNLGLEGLGVTPDGCFVLAACEAPFHQDGNLPTLTDGALTRITVFDTNTRHAVGQYAYPLDPFPTSSAGGSQLQPWQVNGVADVIALSPYEMLVLERAVGPEPSVRLFLAHSRGASDVLSVHSLCRAQVTAMHKTLLVDVTAMPGVPADNYEGMAFGPRLSDGRQSLVLISDNDRAADRCSRLLALAL